MSSTEPATIDSGELIRDVIFQTAERMFGFGDISVGLWMIAHPKLAMVGPEQGPIVFLTAAAPAWVWGAALFTIGVGRFVAIRRKFARARRFFSIAAGFFYSIVAVSLIMAHWQGLSVPITASIAAMNLYSVIASARIRRAK